MNTPSLVVAHIPYFFTDVDRRIIFWFFFNERLRVVLREVVSASVSFLSSPLFLITGTVDSSHPLAHVSLVLAIPTPTPSVVILCAE